MTILYTPGQLRGAISLSPETYRHWKKALGPLRRARGHSPCFKPGDLVAMAIVKTLTQDLGVRVKSLSPIASDLFELCNRSPWAALESTQVAIDLPGESLRLLGGLSETTSGKPIILVPIAPIITHLREQLLTTTDDAQQESLRFPPLSVAGGNRS